MVGDDDVGVAVPVEVPDDQARAEGRVLEQPVVELDSGHLLQLAVAEQHLDRAGSSRPVPLCRGDLAGIDEHHIEPSVPVDVVDPGGPGGPVGGGGGNPGRVPWTRIIGGGRRRSGEHHGGSEQCR